MANCSRHSYQVAREGVYKLTIHAAYVINMGKQVYMSLSMLSFNNYNVNQPIHFCKGCQRYWTAGGALRKVAVGAGRRKAKPQGRDLLGGFTEGCFYDGFIGVHQLELDIGMVVDGSM
ncbi:hypothetical protein PTKIN_Ptkin18bG0117000 [Pterospermum kingtungense]